MCPLSTKGGGGRRRRRVNGGSTPRGVGAAELLYDFGGEWRGADSRRDCEATLQGGAERTSAPRPGSNARPVPPGSPRSLRPPILTAAPGANARNACACSPVEEVTSCGQALSPRDSAHKERFGAQKGAHSEGQVQEGSRKHDALARTRPRPPRAPGREAATCFRRRSCGRVSVSSVPRMAQSRWVTSRRRAECTSCTCERDAACPISTG